MDREQLHKLTMKYSDALRNHRYPRLPERESDRVSLADDQRHLTDPHSWGLDSHVFFLLARTQDEATKQLLLKETSPRQRMSMFGVIARRCFHPLVGIPGRVTFQIPHSLRAEADGAEENDDSALTDHIEVEVAVNDRPGRWETPVRPHTVAPEALLERERNMGQALHNGVDMDELRSMDLEAVQMISHHLGASARISARLAGGQLRLVTGDPDSGATDAPARQRRCIVLANRTMEAGKHR